LQIPWDSLSCPLSALERLFVLVSMCLQHVPLLALLWFRALLSGGGVNCNCPLTPVFTLPLHIPNRWGEKNPGTLSQVCVPCSTSGEQDRCSGATEEMCQAFCAETPILKCVGDQMFSLFLFYLYVVWCWNGNSKI
jgi:hypothetical protein